MPGETRREGLLRRRSTAASPSWKGKVYVGTLDGRLIALDADDRQGGLDGRRPSTSRQPYTITGAPRVVKGKVIIGNGGAEFGVRGYVSAYDAETGKLLWRFYTVPGDPAKPFESPTLEKAAQDLDTANGGSSAAAARCGTRWPTTRSSTCSTSAPATARRGISDVRSPGGGDNLFLSSIVALKPDTGEYVWHYQTTPGETLGLHRHPAHRCSPT